MEESFASAVVGCYDFAEAANEHWLFHGTTAAAATGIAENDFRSMAEFEALKSIYMYLLHVSMAWHPKSNLQRFVLGLVWLAIFLGFQFDAVVIRIELHVFEAWTCLARTLAPSMEKAPACASTISLFEVFPLSKKWLVQLCLRSR